MLCKRIVYKEALDRIFELCKGETDSVSLMATVVCEIHNSDDRFDWTGFYRVASPKLLKIGPYQGQHGCLIIPFSKGVCGTAASTGKIQIVPNVANYSNHIACSSSTKSELVIPVWNKRNQLIGVFDIDSDLEDAFSTYDAEEIGKILDAVFKS